MIISSPPREHAGAHNMSLSAKGERALLQYATRNKQKERMRVAPGINYIVLVLVNLRVLSALRKQQPFSCFVYSKEKNIYTCILLITYLRLNYI